MGGAASSSGGDTARDSRTAQLPQDGGDVVVQPRVGGDEHARPVRVAPLERLRGVQPSLKQDAGVAWSEARGSALSAGARRGRAACAVERYARECSCLFTACPARDGECASVVQAHGRALKL